MRLIIVRHALTPNNEQGLMQENHTPLSDNGETQAERVALRLKKENISVIYTSPYARCRRTAQLIAEYHPRAKIEVVESLRERNHGIYKGKPKQGFLDARNASDLPFGEWKPPEGENDIEVRERVLNFLKEKGDLHKNETIVFVSHGACCNIMAMHLNKLPWTVEDYDSVFHLHTAVTIVDYDKEEVTIETTACRKHLE